MPNAVTAAPRALVCTSLIAPPAPTWAGLVHESQFALKLQLMSGLLNVLIPSIAAIGLGALAASVLNGLRRPAPVPVPVKSRQPPRR